MSRARTLAIFIVAYRAAELLNDCLRSVSRFHPEADVYIWDNSGPSFVEVRSLTVHYPEFHWFFSPRNIGFAAAVNRLAAEVPGRDFLLLNPDAELLMPLNRTVRALREPSVAAAGPMKETAIVGRSPDRKVGLWRRQEMPWDTAYRELTIVNGFSGISGLGERVRGTPFSFRYRTQPHLVNGFISGQCIAIRREAWDALGPFNEEFFLYQEEAEWQRRAIQAGWKIQLADEIAVRHVGRGTVIGDTEGSQRSADLIMASAALMFEYTFGRRAAELYLGWWSLSESVKHMLRGQSTTARRPDILITADGPREIVDARIAEALALNRAGYRVVVVSLQRLGSLPRDLPPSIRLVRRPWWWPSIRPQKLPSVLVVGSTRKELALARLIKLRQGVTVLSGVPQITDSS